MAIDAPVEPAPAGALGAIVIVAVAGFWETTPDVPVVVSEAPIPVDLRLDDAVSAEGPRTPSPSPAER